MSSAAQKALNSVGMAVNATLMQELRHDATVMCSSTLEKPCKPLEGPCLFNVLLDPCEKRNVAEMFVISYINKRLS